MEPVAAIATRHLSSGVGDLGALVALCSRDAGRAVSPVTVRQYRSHFRRWGADWYDRFKAEDRRKKRAAPQVSRSAAKAWAEERNPIAAALGQARGRARRSSIPFELTRESLAELCRPMTCSLTGIPLNWRRGTSGSNPWRASIDQIEPSRGYIAGNVRLVAWAVNQMLRAWTVETVVPLLSEAIELRDRGALPTTDAVAGAKLLDARVHGSDLSVFLRGQRKNHRSVRSASMEWGLDREWMNGHLRRGTCAVTGLSLRWSDVGFDPLKPSIDRIDPQKGYTPENSRITCLLFNLGRGDYADDLFWTVAEALVRSASVRTG